MEIVFIIGRLLFGGFFLMSGLNHLKNPGGMLGYAAAKGVPYPKLAVLGTGALLLAGGIGVIFGVYPTVSLLLILLFLLPTSFIMHAFWQETDKNLKMNEKINFLKNLALAGAALMLLSLPLPWIWSLAI